jgi:hypothetical protein
LVAGRGRHGTKGLPAAAQVAEADLTGSPSLVPPAKRGRAIKEADRTEDIILGVAVVAAVQVGRAETPRRYISAVPEASALRLLSPGLLLGTLVVVVVGST